MTRALASNPYRQRGAIGLFGILTLMMAVVFTALAVDSGRLWMQQRQLQLVADMAAMDAARQMGCGISAADVVAAADASAARNGYTGSLSAAPNQVELGNVSTGANGVRTFSLGGNEAVHVYATREVPASLVAGGLFGNEVTLNAQAVASASPAQAAFSAGTFAARLDTGKSALLNSLLGGMLGSSLSLDLVSYQGLASSNITLLDLLKAYGQVGGADDLLAANMELGQLLELMATAMANSGTNAQATAAMQQLASVSATNHTNISLGDVLNITSADHNSALNVGINALSLAATSIIVANGQHALTIPVSVNVGSITSVTGQVTIIEPPKLAVGPPGKSNGTYCTKAETAQINAQVAVVTTVNVLLTNVKLDLLLKLAVAYGSAGLDSIGDNGSASDVMITAAPGVATISLDNSKGNGYATLSTTVLGITQNIATIGLNLPATSSSTQLNFSVDHPVADNLPQTQTAVSSVADLGTALGNSGVLTINGSSGLVDAVVSKIVSPLLSKIGSALLDPLLQLLGLQIGGMDVKLEGLQLGQQRPLVI